MIQQSRPTKILSRPRAYSAAAGRFVFVLCTICLILNITELAAFDEGTEGKSSPARIDFATQIMPIFSRHGCNAAECHGSATGRGDFKLSLFGGDPARDYDSIVNQLEGRRVNFDSPEKSLLVTKPTEMLAHGGGEVFGVDSVPAKRIESWIASGASNESLVVINQITASQDLIKASKTNRNFQIKIFADSSLGQIDVTTDTTFSASNPAAIELLGSGKISVRRPGKFFVVAKYLQFVIPITIIRPFEDTTGSSTATKSDHELDQVIGESLNELNIPFPPRASPSTFVRRLYLDLTGRLPSVDEAKRFLDSKNPRRKEKLVDRLLASPEFESYWGFWLRNVIQFRRPGNDQEAAQQFNAWLVQAVKEDKGWSELANALITSKGNTTEVTAANFHRLFADARGEAETVANSFLGIRIGCANCHNHPLDRWTQEDYHGLAAIFATIKRGKTVSDLPDGKVIQPKTGRPALARIPGERNLEGKRSHREQLVNWMIRSDRFKYSMSNRIWKHFLGNGIIEPVDDFRSSNPPIDHRLLKTLARMFEKNGFRFRPIIRAIVTSDTYGSQPSAGEVQQFWAGYHVKPLPPEVLHDISRQVLFEPSKNDDSSKWATTNFELAGKDSALRLLKGCDPRGDCIASNSQNQAFGLREKLHLVNGDFLNRWLQDEANHIHFLFSKKRKAKDLSLPDAISEIYWRAYSRPMSSTESEYWKEKTEFDSPGLETEKDKIEYLQDVIWSLLNSREFSTIN